MPHGRRQMTDEGGLSLEPLVDVFASMLFVVILALLAALLDNARAETKVREAHEMMRVQVNMRTKLAQALGDRLGDLVQVDRRTGVISIGEQSLTFPLGEAHINGGGKSLLQKLVQPLAEVAFSPQFRQYLSRIVVEGHTDSSRARNDPYINWNLSSDRALAVVKFMLRVAGPHRKDYERYLEATGMAERVLVKVNGKENRRRSRRIEIKVQLRDKELVDKLAADLASALHRTHKTNDKVEDK